MVEATERKSGFKQTEVGMIPEDWEVKPINQIANIIGGGTPSSFNDKYWNGNINWFTPTEIGERKYVYESTRKISNEGLNNSSASLLPAGSILLTSRAGIGDCAILLKVACTNQGFQSLLAKSVDNEFLYYSVTSHYFQNALMKNASGSTFLEISPKRLKALLIPLPPTLTEQASIATALSDMDALIEAQGKLIAKKRLIKQGAMQELLKPKEGWKVKTIGECADNKKELFNDGDWIEAEHITNSGIRFVQTGNIGIGRFVEKENKKYIFKESFQKLRCKELKKGDLLICRLADPAGRVCILPSIGESKMVTSVDVSIYRPRQEVVNRVFLANLFSTSDWFHKVSERVGGTTHKRISRSALSKIKIHIPEISEQTRIANILSDMDTEIEQLEIQLAKYRQIKTGMMQELLTGKKRLI